ncbi:hypothetical protein [Methanonatronarchaeum sp. AMET-Sl]|uniref:hypothetical protein n=1 Tax=Methanonatronarchaeum sp. AMET-Sl TaxID=3037654 RepID=UPI00244DA9CD|nr:hypothetical protein [Methanonatronarchaeum sp. AMET-Sl]WGI17173.1 hypothetical protein QEN48_06635 [Methanonatronarchaeum sp. AMET-Sl]
MKKATKNTTEPKKSKTHWMDQQPNNPVSKISSINKEKYGNKKQQLQKTFSPKVITSPFKKFLNVMGAIKSTFKGIAILIIGIFFIIFGIFGFTEIGGITSATVQTAYLLASVILLIVGFGLMLAGYKIMISNENINQK